MKIEVLIIKIKTKRSFKSITFSRTSFSFLVIRDLTWVSFLIDEKLSKLTVNFVASEMTARNMTERVLWSEISNRYRKLLKFCECFNNVIYCAQNFLKERLNCFQCFIFYHKIVECENRYVKCVCRQFIKRKLVGESLVYDIILDDTLLRKLAVEVHNLRI